MTTPTLEDAQSLLDRCRGEGMIVSCYADTSIAAGYGTDWRVHLKHQVSRIEARLGADTQAVAELERNLEVIHRALKKGERRAQGMAAFSATRREFFQAFALRVPVSTHLVVDEQPYLVPLLEAMHRQRRYLVVLTDTHRAQIFAVGWGRAERLAALDEAVPKRHRAAGQTWGVQQATIARHREDHVLHYEKELVREIERVWPAHPFHGLILLGAHELLQEVRGRLPTSLQARVVYEASYPWTGRRPTITAKVQALLDAELRADDRRLIEELERRLREGYRVAAGPQEVINALRYGQLGYPGCIVLQPDPGLPAARCTGCGAVFADLHEQCPFCGGRCEKGNLWQEILLLAARHHVPVHGVRADDELSRHGGVAAMLSRSEPWEVASPTASAEARR